MHKFINSFEFNNHTYYYCDLKKVFEYFPSLRKLPFSLKILLESSLRNIGQEDINSIIKIFENRDKKEAISFYANRVIMEESNALPSLVDIASLRNSLEELGDDVEKVKPYVMVDLVIDNRSDENSNGKNLEANKKQERYKLLKWFDNQFKNFSVIFSNETLSNRVNLEYLSTLISSKSIDDKVYIYPELITGTDFHTTIINALGVLGYKAEGIEIQSTILGKSFLLKMPTVIGVEVKGSLSQGVSISDLILSLENLLQRDDLNGKIIEFYGEGLKNLSIEDRASLSNIVSSSNALCGYFPIDNNTISFIEQTRGVDASLIKEYYKKQELYLVNEKSEYDENIVFDLSLIKAIAIGPKKIRDKTYIKEIPLRLDSFKKGNFVNDNDIVEAKIESYFSLANPTLFIQAGLLAKKAVSLGLNINSNIKRVFILESVLIKKYLENLGLLPYLEKLDFILSSKNDDKLVERVVLDIEKFNLNVVSISSFGNNKFEENSNSLIKLNWQMSPALIIAYCLKGNMNFDITSEAIIADIYLSDIWPSWAEVNESLESADSSIFVDTYKNIFNPSDIWSNLEYKDSRVYSWDEKASFVQPCYLYENNHIDKIEIENAKILAIFNESISTNYIYPSGQIPSYSPTAIYLQEKGFRPDEFNTFESRDGNSEIMKRGTLFNIALKNILVKPKEGGYTKDFETNEIMPLYDFSLKMKKENTPLVLFIGEKFGSEDKNLWAAKGLKLLGVKVVIAKSFDNSQRFNLVSMGILPLEFIDEDIESLNIKGEELITIKTKDIKINDKVEVEIKKGNESKSIEFQSRLDTKLEVEYYKNRGVLSYFVNR